MTLASTKLIPELQYQYSNFIKNSSVNRYAIDFPSSIPEIYLQNQTFIELLFNEEYSYDLYYHLYKENTNRYSWPDIVKKRTLIYPTSAQYYECTYDGTNNLFNLEADDLTLLNTLLAYRIDSTSVTIITDATSTIFIDDILYTSYNILSGLAQLIFLYLDLKIYGNYSNYNNETLISNNLLEYCYETFVLDKIFDIVSIKGIS